ncbi:MarR family winged helix-turn-helix transcriptional regulator [Polluticaenibacter yanchengensis]|uniref:MarR family transcriptional regulator n=1 Tax=Polluticaenibacter yanchengensis TaxID=3014562 RepID=A0ABT4UR30_9BACT|nr:MarR family transcriptional regulator [Chitinophagaceae bacterium LY-5]
MKKEQKTSVLYKVEQTIKEYRKMSQKNISDVVCDITVDQCLLLIFLNDNAGYSQKEMAEFLFKDTASLTRIIELMVKKDYLKRNMNDTDRRKFNLEITAKGKETIQLLQPVIQGNRQTALQGLSQQEIGLLDSLLSKITSNCKETK